MKMAYLGDGLKRQSNPVKLLLAAIAMLFMPMAALAQQPTDAPPMLPTEEAPAVPEAAPAAEAAAPAGEEGGNEGMEEAFSLAHIWTASDEVGKGTLILMIIMFAGSIYIAVTKAVDQTMLSNQMKKIPAFWDANTLDEGLDLLGRNNAFRAVAEGAIAQANSARPASVRVSRAPTACLTRSASSSSASTRASRAAWPSSRRSAPSARSSVCSERCGAS
jgi:hypothetical protein